MRHSETEGKEGKKRKREDVEFEWKEANFLLKAEKAGLYMPPMPNDRL